MVSVLALNKLELKDMINTEMVENPVLEELESQVPLLDEVAGREEEREREAATAAEEQPAAEKTDAFDEIDFGTFFQDYLDPGYRSPAAENVDKPSFENFLSRPATLTDHLMWQLGAASVNGEVREAAELVIGNLNEDGYLTATEEELLGLPRPPAEVVSIDAGAAPPVPEADQVSRQQPSPTPEGGETWIQPPDSALPQAGLPATLAGWEGRGEAERAAGERAGAAAEPKAGAEKPPSLAPPARFSRAGLREALELVRQMDPMGVGARDLRECLLAQLQYQQQLARQKANGDGVEQVIADAIAIVDTQLHPLENKQHKEISRAIGRPVEEVMKAVDYIRTLDPKPGLRYNKTEPRLIEPDVAFVKQGDEWVVVMNDEDLPQLRLNPAYRRFLARGSAEREVRSYVKERYKSAIQLIKNIEQRKQTILKVCYAVIGRQREFLERGIDHLKPMMIKEVAEEIGVHPSTVSRAVASKYAHTPQGVFELRYFFSESVNGPEGGGTSLLILKRRVKKLIAEEDPARPLTDEQITRILQSQGIQVTRRTVAKYREDMRIPSTHQRRVKP